MAMHKFTAYVAASTADHDFGKLKLLPYDPTPFPNFKEILVSEHEIEIDVPGTDFHEKAIDAIQREIQKERADSQVRVNLLLERISKLQAIGHDGGDV